MVCDGGNFDVIDLFRVDQDTWNTFYTDAYFGTSIARTFGSTEILSAFIVGYTNNLSEGSFTPFSHTNSFGVILPTKESKTCHTMINSQVSGGITITQQTGLTLTTYSPGAGVVDDFEDLDLTSY